MKKPLFKMKARIRNKNKIRNYPENNLRKEVYLSEFRNEDSINFK